VSALAGSYQPEVPITRTVNEEPDEFNTPGTGRLLGFFELPANSVNNEYVRNNASTFLEGTGFAPFISKYEYSPDIFSFSFLGYSGYFVMGYDKTFKIQSQDIIKVEKDASNLIGLNNTVYFRLTSNNGTKFTFGSEEGSVELSRRDKLHTLSKPCLVFNQDRIPPTDRLSTLAISQI